MSRSVMTLVLGVFLLCGCHDLDGDRPGDAAAVDAAAVDTAEVGPDGGAGDVGGPGSDATDAAQEAAPPPKTWTELKPGTAGDYTAVAVSGGHVLVGTNAGAMLYSKDSGKSWNKVWSMGTRVHDIVVDGATALAVTSKGKIYRAQSDFSQWTSPGSCGQSAFGVGLQGKVAVVVGPGRRCVSDDGGKTFSDGQVSGTFIQYRGAAAALVQGKVVVLAVGYPSGGIDPLLHRSEDDGKTWTDLSDQLKSPGVQLFSVAMAGGGRAIIGASKGNVFTSADGGKTWAASSTGNTYKSLHSVALSPPLALGGCSGSVAGAFLCTNNGAALSLLKGGPVDSARVSDVALDGQGKAYLAGKALIKGTP